MMWRFMFNGFTWGVHSYAHLVSTFSPNGACMENGHTSSLIHRVPVHSLSEAIELHTALRQI